GGAFEKIERRAGRLNQAMDCANGSACILRHFGIGFVEFAVGLLGHLTAFTFFAAHESIILRTLEADANWMFGLKCLRHLASDVYGNSGLATRAGVVEVSADPAGRLDFFRIGSRLPDFCRTKMRAIWVRVTDALNDRNLPRIVEVFKPSQIFVQTDVV